MLSDAGRFPVSDYEQAKQWLWTYSRPWEWFDDVEPDQLPLEAQLICDVFWVTPDKLLRDLRRAWRDTMAPTRPVPPRRSLHVWGR